MTGPRDCHENRPVATEIPGQLVTKFQITDLIAGRGGREDNNDSVWTLFRFRETLKSFREEMQ